MGLEGMGDCQPEPPGHLQIDIDIGPGIDHRGRAGRVISEKVRALGHAIGQDLLEADSHEDLRIARTQQRERAMLGACLLPPWSCRESGGNWRAA